jgi:hypothetical protein
MVREKLHYSDFSAQSVLICKDGAAKIGITDLERSVVVH